MLTKVTVQFVGNDPITFVPPPKNAMNRPPNLHLPFCPPQAESRGGWIDPTIGGNCTLVVGGRDGSLRLFSRAVCKCSMAGFGVLLMAVLQPPVGAQNREWKEQNDRIQQNRADSEKRYERWRLEQEQANQTWRDAPNNEKDRVLELPNSGLKPGQYNLRLPFGLGGVRLNVPDNPQAPKAAPGWDERTYGDVYQRARKISDQLRELRRDLQKVGSANLIEEAGRIHGQGVEMANAAALRRPASEMRTQFAEFDQLWHPFSHRIGREADVGANVQRRVAVVNQLEDGLHQLIRISPAAPYNRPLVAALTNELQVATDSLLKDLRIEPQRTFDLQTITMGAKRVKQHAIDLNATVIQNAPLATIVDEYEEFDRAWHRLLQQARVSPDVDAHVRRLARQVRQVDQQLHKELYVNVPVVNDRQQLIYLAAGISKSSEELADEVEAQSGRGKQDLVDEARTFAAAAQELKSMLSERPSAKAEQGAFTDLLDSWQRLNAMINSLNGERFQESQSMASQMMTDIQRLEKQWRVPDNHGH